MQLKTEDFILLFWSLISINVYIPIERMTTKGILEGVKNICLSSSTGKLHDRHGSVRIALVAVMCSKIIKKYCKKLFHCKKFVLFKGMRAIFS